MLAVNLLQNKTTEVEIVSPHFIDPEGINNVAKLVLKIKKPLDGYSKVINKLKIAEYQFDSLISLAIPLKSERKCKLNFKKSLGEPMPNIEKSIINKSGILGFRIGLDLLLVCNASHSSFAKKTVIVKTSFLHNRPNRRVVWG